MSATWPDSLFAAPLLRGLDGGGRKAIEGGGALRSFAAGEAVFTAGTVSDDLFVVVRGEVELLARPRALSSEVELEARLVRVARAGETFGEEAALAADGLRSLDARAKTAAEVAVIPAVLFRRALGRSGRDLQEASPEQRLLRRQATANLLAQVPLTAELPELDRERLLDAAVPEFRARGETIFERGDPPDGLWLIADGLVQLQSPGIDGEPRVRAYLRAGDVFGDAELLEGRARALTAVAMGHSQLSRIEVGAYRELVDRHPALLEAARRLNERRDAHEAAALAQAPSTTRHAFQDLYRMQMARSLLTIDQDACVRCGHCAWSCAEVHGVARLVRRGDKVVTRLKVVDQPESAAQPAARELLLPNSCQHCKNPSCMLDCPTGAVGRDPEGEVFIREELCTGCGACAKACPWENIRMAPRGSSSTQQRWGEPLREAAERKGMDLLAMFPEVATKCDSCRAYEAPACVQSCPTEAIVRLEPERDFGEVAAFLGVDAPDDSKEGRGALGAQLSALAWPLALTGLGAASLIVCRLAVALHQNGGWSPGRSWGLAGGLAAAAVMGLLAAYALPKRGVRRWMRPRVKGARADEAPDRGRARSRVRPHFRVHLLLGLALPALILAHTGWSLPANASGLLALLAWITLALGAFGGLSYAWIPPALTRLERRGALPEDLATERERLEDRLQRALSGKSAVLKGLARDHLLPWARTLGGGAAMVLRGQSVSEARAMLRERVEGWLPEPLRRDGLQPQARAEALAGLDALLDVCIELRALTARRVLTTMLRGWLGPHILLTGALGVALVVHVAVMAGPALAGLLPWFGGAP